MQTVKIRNLEIGAGAPKVIVPIVGKTREEILAKAAELKGTALDMVEWRADFCECAPESAKLLEIAEALRAALGETPLLFTFRTSREGGEKTLALADYTELNRQIAQSGLVDAVDVEIFAGEEVAVQNIAAIHAAGAVVIGSNHDFAATPPKEEILCRLRKMQELGADIAKIAVMPHSPADVITLLDATQEMAEKYAVRPIVAMSMGPLGVISRLGGEVFGSAMTFGAVGQVSAPGQIPAEQLQTVLKVLHDAMQ